ncbi:myelin basic protein-like isoform X3 [Hypomesus transpacificus]|uniref:myelin basic protein-like isoform X3 n=1 Tax=Hypomesus transpacificus TaxID=137520 RepID=UPI001F0713E2|nr:myelin basic protein-like isoform X3 [Hypomesus transpacificus]
MATASTSGQSRKKKSPGLLDQIGTFFGGEKKKARSKGSFRGHLSTAPPRPAASARRHGADNAVMQFLRSFVSTPQPKSRWREILGLASSPRPEGARSPLRRRRDQNTLSRIFNLGETKARSPPKRWSTIF